MLHFVQPQCEIRTISLSEPLKTRGAPRQNFFCLLNIIYTRETFGVLPLLKHLHDYLKCRAIITFSQLQCCDDMFTTSSARLSSPTALMQIKISLRRANSKGSATTSHQHQGENVGLISCISLLQFLLCQYERQLGVKIRQTGFVLETALRKIHARTGKCLSKANKNDMPGFFSFSLFKKIKVTSKLS